MSWFDTWSDGTDPEESWRRLDAAVGQSGVDTALAQACGPRGLRRFVLYFERRAGKMRLGTLDAQRLPRGGGPPPTAAWEAAAPAVEAALERLGRTMPPPFQFERGAVGVVRDETGKLDVHFRFDADADQFSVNGLRQPVGEPDPMEDPAWLRALAAWEAAMGRVRAAWEVGRAEETWSFTKDRLRVSGPAGTTERPAECLATWTPATGRYAWLVAEPVAEEAPCVEPELAVSLAEAGELAAYAAARRQARGVFQGSTPEGTVVYMAVKG